MADEKDRIMKDDRDLARDLQGRDLITGSPDSLPPGSAGVVACLQAWKPSGPEGTPSPKICLKLPLMFLALAMTFWELKYAWPLHSKNRYNLTF